MKATTQKEIKLKDGRTMPKGLPVSFKSDSYSRCFVTWDRPEPYQVRITSAFKAPSLNKLEEWNNDGVCDSILGERVEPDGWDEFGSPSWMLAMGLI